MDYLRRENERLQSQINEIIRSNAHIRKPRTCPYVYKRKARFGQVCGKNCMNQYCAQHTQEVRQHLTGIYH